jgi:hypothetical protein
MTLCTLLYDTRNYISLLYDQEFGDKTRIMFFLLSRTRLEWTVASSMYFATPVMNAWRSSKFVSKSARCTIEHG